MKEEGVSGALPELTHWMRKHDSETDPAAVSEENSCWSVEGQQLLTPKQLGKARWISMNLSGQGPFGLVPRQTDSEVLDVIGHEDLVRTLSSAWELPYAGVEPMDGLTQWKTTAKGSVMKVPTGADQLLIIPMMGEVSLVNQGSEPIRLGEQATLLRRIAEGSQLTLKPEAALLVLYRLKQQKNS